MTYRYAIVSGALIGIVAGVIVEGLMWLDYIGMTQQGVALLLLIVCPLLVFVILGRWRISTRGRTCRTALRSRTPSASLRLPAERPTSSAGMTAAASER
jgi:hypothetical protein